MVDDKSPLADWTPEQIAAGKRWVETWRRARIELEQIKREELRKLDNNSAIEKLFGTLDPEQLRKSQRLTSGLVEMQRWFMRAARRG